MTGRRKSNLGVGMSRLYVYKGKRTTTYYTITPDNKRINLGHDLNAAKRELLNLSGNPSQPDTVSDCLDDLIKLREKQVMEGKRSATTLASNLLEVENLKKAFGKMYPRDIKPTHIWHYLHKYRGKEAPVRANREIALLSRMFSRAMGAGLTQSNPCVGVERNEEVPRDNLVSDGEFRAFFKFAWGRGDAPRRIALALLIAYLTGKAQGQVRTLTHHQVKQEGIYFGKRKRGAATLVQWTPMLRKAVKVALAMPSSCEPLHVIHTQDGCGYSVSGFKSIWQRLINDWEAQGNARFTFHDLRAKTVTDMEEQGRKASNLTGHNVEQTINQVYDRRRVRKSRAVR